MHPLVTDRGIDARSLAACNFGGVAVPRVVEYWAVQVFLSSRHCGCGNRTSFVRQSAAWSLNLGRRPMGISMAMRIASCSRIVGTMDHFDSRDSAECCRV